jgi:hypothetical protein
MSTDQAPEKVKLYSGDSGGRRGVRAVSGAGGQRQPESDARAVAEATSAAALAASAEEEGGINWLVLILFVLGCALGGAIFTLFARF